MKVKLIVDGGNMKPGPAVSQQLGPMGINLGKVIVDVNAATSGFKGMKVPVELDVDPKTKNYSIKVSSPPVSELIKKELNLEKASGQSGKVWVGNLAIEQIIKIAKTKMPGMLAKDIKSAVSLVVGSCVSLGVLIENKPAKELLAEIQEGKYDNEISKEKMEVSPEKKSSLDKHFKEVASQQEAAAKAEEEAKAAEEAKKAETVTAETAAKPEEKKEEPKEAKKK
jgi:large subunit ribosomal protein L11